MYTTVMNFCVRWRKAYIKKKCCTKSFSEIFGQMTRISGFVESPEGVPVFSAAVFKKALRNKATVIISSCLPSGEIMIVYYL